MSHAQLDNPIKSVVTHLTKTKRLQKLSASLAVKNTKSSRLTSTLDKKQLSKWDGVMVKSNVMGEELNHLRLLMMKV